MCVNILLKERPFAKDLKEVTGVLKLVSDLERIGDHAEDIYDFATKLIGYKEKEEKNTLRNLLRSSRSYYSHAFFDPAHSVGTHCRRGFQIFVRYYGYFILPAENKRRQKRFYSRAFYHRRFGCCGFLFPDAGKRGLRL